MLEEAISYQDNFPIAITVADITRYPIHYHKDTEIVYVLDGSINLRNGYCTYSLNAGDIFTNAGHEVHTMEADTENITAVFHISNLFFTQFFPDLPKGCFRTNPSNDPSPRLPHLKHTLLQLLIAYLQKNINYRDTCIEHCMEVVRTLNRHFNLFAFNDDVVVHFNCDNPVIEERISHVINYIYANHELKITLDDLAEMEHLSSYYLSHLIRQYCGISFRDFLSFARAEWSEIYLLETDKKINTVAHMVGFSTSKYYEDAFVRWFGHTPREHRAANQNNVISPDNPPVLKQLTVSRALDAARRLSSRLIQQDTQLSMAKRIHLTDRIPPDAEPIAAFRHHLKFSVTTADFESIGYSLFDHLRQLCCTEVVLICRDDDDPKQCDELEQRFLKRGINVERQSRLFPGEQKYYGFDSVAGLNYIVRHGVMEPNSTISLGLRDQGDPDVLLKGGRSLLTSGGVPKPMYTGLNFLVSNEGELVLRNKYYAAVRLHNKEAYILMATNYNSDILGLCQGTGTIYHADDVLNSFQDELTVNIAIDLNPGEYLITRYSTSTFDSMFGLMSKLHFPEKLPLTYDIHLEYTTNPIVDAYVEQVRSELSVDMNFRGAGVQAALIQKI